MNIHLSVLDFAEAGFDMGAACNSDFHHPSPHHKGHQDPS
jgi:hypothetical protein